MGMPTRCCAGTIWYHDLAEDDSEWQVSEGSVSGKAALQVNVGHGGGDAAWLPNPWKRKDGLTGEGLRSPEVVTSSLWDSPDIQRVWSPRALDLYLPQWEECLSNMAVVLERA